MQTQKLSGRFWTALALLGLVGQVAWVVENMYLNVFIYQMFNASAAAISTMVAASAVTATLTTLLMGAVSDRVGKRKIFICLGYFIWGVSVVVFSLLRTDVLVRLFPAAAGAGLGVTLVIVQDCVMTFFGSTANDACLNAWLTDAVDDANRGKVEGVNAMMPLVAILVVFGGFMSYDLTRQESWIQIFTIIGVSVALAGLAGFVLIREPAATVRSGRSVWSNLIYGFRPGVLRANPQLYLVLAAFAVFGISIQIFMPYLILYYTETLQMDNYVLVMAPAIVLAAGATVAFGRLYDRWGFGRCAALALAALAAGYGVLAAFEATGAVFAGSLLMMTGYLTGMTVFGAKIRSLIPPQKAGSFQGLRICGQVLIPGVVGPYVGAFVLRTAQTVVNTDGTTSFVPNANIFLAALGAAVLVVPILLLVLKKSAPGAKRP